MGIPIICRKCKACYLRSGQVLCILGYPISAQGRPEVPCPNPRTYLALIDARDEQDTQQEGQRETSQQ